jgi:hypothetical protein
LTLLKHHSRSEKEICCVGLFDWLSEREEEEGKRDPASVVKNKEMKKK